jgi:hypothetical protein
MTFVKIGEIIPYKTLQWKRARFVFLMKTRHSTLIALRLNLLSWSLGWIKISPVLIQDGRSQFRRTLVVSRHCLSSSDRRWPHITTLFDANRSQSWAALSGLTEEKDAIFLLVFYRPSHIIFYGTCLLVRPVGQDCLVRWFFLYIPKI